MADVADTAVPGQQLKGVEEAVFKMYTGKHVDRVNYPQMINRNHRCFRHSIPRLYLQIKEDTTPDFVQSKIRTLFGIDGVRVVKYPDYYEVYLPQEAAVKGHQYFNIFPQTETETEIDLKQQIELVVANQSCKMLPCQIETYRSGHVCATIPLLQSHLCDGRDAHFEKEKTETYTAFICERSGKIHFCGKHCGSYHEGPEKELLCTLTGLVIEMRQMVSPLPPLPRCPGLYNPLERRVTGKTLVAPIENPDIILRSATPNLEFPRSRLETLQDHLRFAQCALLSILSEERFREEKVANESKRHAKSELLKREIAKQESAGGMVVMTKLLPISDDFDTRTVYHSELTLSRNETIEIAQTYSVLCVKLWYLLNTQKWLDQETRNLFTFTNFIAPAIYVLAEGVTKQFKAGEVASIIDPDVFLRRLPLNINIERYTNSNKNLKTRSRSRSSHNISLQIQRVLREAAERSPLESLRLDNINIHAMDESVFRAPKRKIFRSASVQIF